MRRRRRLRRWGWRLLGVAISLPLFFTLVFALALLGREVTAPGWLKADVESRASELLDGGSMSFGDLRMTLGTDLHPRVVLANAELRDRDGAMIAVVPRLTALLSPRGLISGEVLVQEVDLSAVQIALRRGADGGVSLQIGATAGATSEGGFVDLLDGIDAALEAPRLAALEQVRVTGLIINYDDARAGRSWTVDGGRLSLDLRRNEVALRGAFSLLSGRAYLTGLSLSYVSPKGSRAAELSMRVTDGFAQDLASQSAALSWLSVIDAPLAATLNGSIDSDGNIGPLDAAISLGAGALQPSDATRPIAFNSAEADFTFDPAISLLEFDRLNVDSQWGRIEGTGRSWLRAFENGFPGQLLAQFNFDEAELNPAEMYPEPVRLGEGSLAFRMSLSPFKIEIAEFHLAEGLNRFVTSGTISAEPEGWAVRADVGLRDFAIAKAMAIWPASLRPNTRAWFAQNMQTGRVTEANAVIRLDPQSPPELAASFEYEDLTLQVMRTMPPIEGAAGHGVWEDGGLTIVTETGLIRAPQGGALSLDGSVFSVPDLRVKDPPAVIAFRTRGTLTAALSILDRPPFEFLTKANLPVTLADARATARGTLSLPLKERIPREEIRYSVDATLRDVRSETLIENRQFAASSLAVRVDQDGLEVEGPMRIGQVPLTATFRQGFVDNPDRQATVTANIELSERFLDEFQIGLPPGMMRGDGNGRLELELAANSPPAFRLDSDLGGLSLSMPSIGWSKGPGTRGAFSIAGRLGAPPQIDRISLSAAGLSAAGNLQIGNNGRLISARFADLRVGDWLRGTVRLSDRGAGQPMAVSVSNGALDLRNAAFQSSGGPAPPMTLELDRLTISEGIALTGFRGEFSGGAGLSGQFSAQVNGGGAIRGTTVPREAGRTAVRVVSDDAGAVISSAGLLQNAVGGSLDLTLLPTGGERTFDGSLAIKNIRVRDAPALAGLLDAISVVGLLQQLDGQGLAFSDVDASFRLAPDRIVVTQSSAVGASLGISLDGTYLTASKQMDFQGVVSPLYLINGIGAVLTRPGEGLIGFNFTLAGPVGDTRVGVNPLSALTPGMFREIFRRPPPSVGQ